MLHYFSYLESFERINFFGEDAEDVLSAGRPHTPVGVGTLPTHVPSITTSGMWRNEIVKHFHFTIIESSLKPHADWFESNSCNK